jgi:hypothetical protein
LFSVATRCAAADEPLSRVQIARLGKAAIALVEVKGPQGEGAASAYEGTSLRASVRDAEADWFELAPADQAGARRVDGLGPDDHASRASTLLASPGPLTPFALFALFAEFAESHRVR